jgi:hypothetical protein
MFHDHSAGIFKQSIGARNRVGLGLSYTDKKENQILIIYKEILNRAVAKSYMRKGFLIHILGNAQLFKHL